ncbi:MAG: VOC family protein [Limimaricola sp.]|uniref:VOC family protein n=1 Tax=Limimaricola sp. TaxID=2211665 RepID=UPI001DE93164|nr:VOC family protein [Limimaricola sp.]MBI1417171.1 VOC family protein [Limimaricola sp.]
MISYVTVGADDLPRAERFYSAFLPSLGYVLDISAEGLSYAIPVTADLPHEQVDLYVKPPFDGRAASAGNGTMVAFKVPSQVQVRALHAAALASGGQNEGAPGFRAAYGPHFYVGYLRDPQGNKIALFSNNRDEPGRPD